MPPLRSAGSPPPAGGKLPVASDLDQIFNRISMGMAKHQRILETLHQGRSTAPPAAVATAPPIVASDENEKEQKRGFSSLAAKASSSLGPPPPQQQQQQRSAKPSLSTTAAAAAEDMDLNPFYAAPPNAGIGWVPPGLSSSSTAAVAGSGGDDRLLRARLQLGRRVEGRSAAAQKAERGKKRGHGAAGNHGSEEEEELGRSAVGRSKARAPKRPRTTGMAAPGEANGEVDGGRRGRSGDAATAPEAGSGGSVVLVAKKAAGGDAAQPAPEKKGEEYEAATEREYGAVPPVLGDEGAERTLNKKAKKKKKKNKKKGTTAAAAAAP
ncbi:hypothetical protein B0T26DRAFT_680156 [Lasiosphaeria miniovina]|uniref:Uncharacterized protein n=1 Tax=Lasiosphaeria miniovina TaxID=1954250 RepID=A0AA39ZZW8_9PEZI|nr:uncharacterized protein B0T26DRAFT_680156 [Lasiosphaeria miniovina]KAK0706479.1 hypothetical protein B0T26DRAFT_680156 [Lasiosphaeria miniovina]